MYVPYRYVRIALWPPNCVQRDSQAFSYVFNVPQLAAECERTFSTAGSMVTIRRTRLRTDVISGAQTIRSWIKAGLMEDYDGIALRSTEIEALEDELGQ
ncbi:hypothetical protein EDB81DRAFT_668666 [Dactylonectria macrodidyma]|uniref:HAT C-terminal dimerisation domain-containing protein n=1 Tax=Dactylonectria macrodidyma TaxID=307937 RepID=A0A9P9IDY5_9HYPO|nr:hypothetical protein EDB81DRAFT_668666 [Dactylonectria macrodidyma]